MAKISVIIPCYNMEKYIDRCMKSIVNQTIGIENLEVILVDDASTDGTLEKLLQWEKNYSDNVLVVSCDENGKQGTARNIGLSYASSEYVGFVDADDWVDQAMYEELFQKMKLYDCDLVRCKFVREHYEHEKRINTSLRQDEYYEFEDVNGYYWGQVDKTGNNGEYGSICCCLFKLDIIKDNNICFPEHIAFEDNFWGAMVKLYIQKLYIVDWVYYHYFINMHSTVTVQNSLNFIDRLDIEMYKLKEFKERGVFEIFYLQIEAEFVRYYFLNTWFLFFTRYTEIPNGFNEMKKVVNDNFPNWSRNPYLKCNTERELMLVKMMKDSHEYSVDELEKFRKAYGYIN